MNKKWICQCGKEYDNWLEAIMCEFADKDKKVKIND